ncbi:MAG: DUF6273 domain-containing protein [bacterium]|nr:DUF6273 domain-containing protein [bacterium]
MKKKLIPIIGGICGVLAIGGILLAVNLNKKPSNKANDDPRYQIYLKAKDAGYEGTYEEWLSSIRGDEVELRVADNYIQMKYKKDTTWTNLISLDLLKGSKGENGNDGLTIKSQLQVNDGYIQFKNDNETTWTNLIAISDLTGDKGDKLELNVNNGYINYKYENDTDWVELIELSTLTGSNGKDGKEVTMSVESDYIVWKYDGETNWNNLISLDTLKGDKGATGDKGEKSMMQVNDGFIQWKNENDTTWTNLVSIDTLTGSNGKEVTMSVESDYIVWKYNEETNWNNLVSLETLKGDKGDTGEAGEKSMMQVNDGFIQWKNENDTTWTNLVSIDTLTGSNGKEVTMSVESNYIVWKYVGETSWNNLISIDTLTGRDGKEVTMSVEGNYIVWKYVGDDSWTNLVSIDELKGDKGDNGEKALFRVDENGYLQYKYESDTEWTNLYKLVPDVEVFEVFFEAYPGELAIEPEDLNHYSKVGFEGDLVEYGGRVYEPYDPIAPSGYVFDGWYYYDMKWSFKANVVTKDMDLEAHYVRANCNLSLDKNNNSAGYVFGKGTYEYDSSVTIVAITNPGYTFDGWYDGETLISAENEYTFNITDQDVTYTAHWALNEYKILMDNQAEGVLINGVISGNKYEFGSEITLTAISVPSVPSGKTLKWSSSNGNVHYGDTYVFNVPCENITITTNVETIYTRNENKIYFGTYPQTLVSDTTITNLLDDIAGTLPTSDNLYNWTDYNYYISGRVQSYMYYQDIDFNGDGAYDYRGVYFTQYRPNETEFSSTENNGYQDNNGYYINSVYWFSYDPVEWDILEESDGKALIFANLILDSQEFHPSHEYDTYDHNGGNGHTNNYELSNIRKFLNETFYKASFNDLQKTIIETTLVDNSVNTTQSSENSYVCNNTNDKLFLLSYKEITEKYFTNSSDAKAHITEYAKSQGLNIINHLSSEWGYYWLRSPIDNLPIRNNYVSFSGSTGSTNDDKCALGVRPACWIKL